MTAHLVVPTLAGAPPQNQPLEGFWVASCESRANRGRSIEVDPALRTAWAGLKVEAAPF
jgi:hypothetical protein